MKKNTILTICLSLFLVGGLFSQTVYVSATGAGAMDGTSEANAYGNFANALVDINSNGDKLIVIGTVTVESATIWNKNFAFTIEGKDATSTITGNGGTSRLFTLNQPTTIDVTFKDLTFSNYNTTLAGGGVLLSNNAGAAVTFDNCIITGNSVTNNQGGGALFFANGTLNIIDSSFENNTSSTKGGAIFANSGTISISNTLFKTNSAASKGGAIYTVNADFAITGSTFYDNETTGAGGGSAFYVAGSGSSNSITNCTFLQNTTANGNQDYGTIRTDNGNTTVTNSLFYDNKTNNNTGGYSDWGSGGNGTQTFETSIAQWISTNIDNQDEGTGGSITGIKGGTGTPADLTNSNLSWNGTLNKVSYTAPDALTNDTPIDFGTDNNDVGAYDSKINLFEGTTDSDWGIAGNWSGTVPSSADNATFLSDSPSVIIGSTLGAVTNNLSVHSNSSLTLNSGGSLIVSGTSTGDVTYNRNLTTTNWYLVSSPISGQAYDDTYVTDNGITSGTGNNRGIATYTTVDNNWSYLLSGGTGSFNNGQGYSVNRNATGDISFTGTINTTDVSVAVANSGTGFNLIGNPFTSHLTSATFLTDNTAKLVSQTLWVWNQGTSSYDTYVTGDLFVLAPAQGFFVRSSNGTNLNIAESYQASTGGTFQKSTKTEVKLMMNDGSANRFAKMYYLDNATKGFDNGFDGETFGGIDDILGVFTHLVADNQGKKYQVQSLPISEMESMIIPVGIIAEAGKELTFSMTGLNIPSDVKIYLEDRLANTFNELTDSKTFKVTLSEALNDVGRFYIHSSKSALSADDALALNGVSIYKSNATTLKVVGLPNGKSNIKLFNILGKQVLNTSFMANGVKEITLPKLATGIYIVQLETETSKLNKKIVLE